MNINYKKLTEITVKKQEELDMIPDSFKGKIYIECDNCLNTIVVSKRYYCSVEVKGNSSIEARGSSFIEAVENSSVVARGSSYIVAMGQSFIEAMGNTFVLAMEDSSVIARGNSFIEAIGNSSVIAWQNSSVIAKEKSSIIANSNVQVIDYLQGSKIKVFDNARIVHMPKSVIEFMDFYDLKHTNIKGTFFKAVHKEGENYYSTYNNNFVYKIGEVYSEHCSSDINANCESGLYVAHLNWALDWGANWKDLAILEVESQLDDIVLPKYIDGTARTSKFKVLREVPLEECGLYGRIIFKRINARC